MLEQLGMKHAELGLIHWPGLCDWDPTDMTPLQSPSDFQPKASTWDDYQSNIKVAWENMLQLKEDGLVLQIGTSNFYPHHLEELARQCDGAVPFANEIFIDASNQEPEFVEAMQAQGIRVLAYRPLAHKFFPDAIKRVAERMDGATPQSVVLAWLLRRGVWPLVKCRGQHIEENLVRSQHLKERLSDEDLLEIRGAEVGIKVSPEWFAKFWKLHREAGGVSDEDIAMLVGMGVDEAKARAVLEKCGGNLDTAMDSAFAE